MKLYKFDYRGTIGNNVITVPTDSQFLVGISNGDNEAVAKLYDGETEIPAEEDKVGKYTCFRFETDGTPKFMRYKAVLSGTGYEVKIDILVISQKMTVAYRDLEGGGGITAEEAVEAAKDSGEFLVKNAESGSFYTEETFETTNSIIMSGPGPDFETCLELDTDTENARVNAFGTINGEDLTISNVVVENFKDDSFDLYEPMTVTVKVGGVERQVKVFGYIAD